MMIVLYVITIKTRMNNYIVTELPNRMDWDVKNQNELFIHPLLFYSKKECLNWYKLNEERILDKIDKNVVKSDYLVIRLQGLTLNDNIREDLDLYEWENKDDK